MKPTTALWILAPLASACLVLVGTGTIERAAQAGPGAGVAWDDQEAAFVREIVARTYVDELTEKQARDAFHAALDGYVKSLPDPYNAFIPPDEYRRWKENAAGHYAGIGVKVDARPKEGLALAGVFPGGPADRAGLKVGDVVTHVEGASLAEADLGRDANVRMLKGAVGTAVTVSVTTPPPAGAPEGTLPVKRRVTIVRDEIRPPTVFARRLGADGRAAADGRIGYLRLTEFVASTADDFGRALDGFVAAGVKAVVVDVRNNGGGVLPATVEVADRFVRSGGIVQMRGRGQGSTRVETAKDEGTIPESIGLVVLVNGHSASASEVLAGCIQDHRRGVLLGTRTYGKFLVQNITEIPGKAAAVKLTSARYQTPSGRWYARDPKQPDAAAGLIPDLVVELSAVDAERLAKQQENEEDAIWGSKVRHADVPAGWVDPQLQKALEVIEGNLSLQEIRRDEQPPRNG